MNIKASVYLIAGVESADTFSCYCDLQYFNTFTKLYLSYCEIVVDFSDGYGKQLGF